MIKKVYNDCETTSTDPRRGAIIQWTSIFTIDGQEVDNLDLTIQPHEGALIEDGALEANGITREELFHPARFTPAQAHKIILTTCGKYVDKFKKQDKFFWSGFNAKFDLDFTHEFFRLCGDVYCGSWFWAPPLDLMILAGFLFQKKRATMENFKLRTVWNALFPERINEFSEDEWHDALFDIRRTIEIEDGLRAVLRGDRKIV